MEALIFAVVVLGIACYILAGEMYFWKREADRLRFSLQVTQAQWDAAKVMLPADFRRHGDDAIRESKNWLTNPEVTGGTP